jgi:hypothetical protein
MVVVAMLMHQNGLIEIGYLVGMLRKGGVRSTRARRAIITPPGKRHFLPFAG